MDILNKKANANFFQHIGFLQVSTRQYKTFIGKHLNYDKISITIFPKIRNYDSLAPL